LFERFLLLEFDSVMVDYLSYTLAANTPRAILQPNLVVAKVVVVEEITAANSS
jgi:hypothetical protein